MIFDLPNEILALEDVRRTLHQRFPNQHTFALDGRLLGDIGECIASEIFAIDISIRRRGVDGSICIEVDGGVVQKRYVQIKCTACNNGPAFRYLEEREAYYLLFLQLEIENKRGRIIYNGPERIALSRMPRFWNNQRSLTMPQIIAANAEVEERDRLTPVQSAFERYNLRAA